MLQEPCFFYPKNKFKGELYHFVSEHISVKQIANFCLKFNKNIKLINTRDKIPYLGYIMDCSKILDTGFVFKYFYEDFVRKYLT